MNTTSSARGLAAALTCLCVLAPLHAKERTARLTIELKVTGTETMRNGRDHATTHISQSLQLVTQVRSDGQLASVNVKDPEYGQKMQAQALAQHHRVQEVQAMQARAAEQRRAQGAPPMATTAASPADMMAQAQAMQARCGTDQQCLMNEAMKLSARQVSGNDAALQQRLEQHGAERVRCEREFAQDARRRAACLDAAQVRAGGSAGGNYEAPADDRFLSFHGFDGCGARFSALIDDRQEGRYADVQGMVPYTVTRKANWTADATHLRIICSTYNLVHDVKSGTLFTDGLVLPEVRGQQVRVDAGRKSRSDTALALRSEALTWASEQLRQAPAAGTRKATLPIRSTSALGTVDGALQVELTWRFE